MLRQAVLAPFVRPGDSGRMLVQRCPYPMFPFFYTPMLRYFRTYGAVFRTTLSYSMEYRTNFVMNNLFGLVIAASVHMYLWKAVYDSTPQMTIAAMDVGQMLLYIAVATLCARITEAGRLVRKASEEIRSGELNKYLLKPISHMMYSLIASLAERATSFVFVVGLAFAIGIPLANHMDVSLSMEGVVLALPILLCGLVINLFMSITISYLAFWFDEVWTFHVVKDICLWFLSGQLLPMSALPDTARWFANVLPFQHLAYVPAGLILGSITPADYPYYLASALAWVGITAGITAFVWNRGLMRFGAYGG